MRDRDDEIEEKMNKVSLVTLWIDPTTHQILQYTFDNIDMDFLPGRIARPHRRTESLDEDAAAFSGCLASRHHRHAVLPDDRCWAGERSYDVDYRDYRLAEVTTRIKP